MPRALGLLTHFFCQLTHPHLTQPLAVSVARMYTSIGGGGSGGGHDEWQYVGVWGAVALIVDRQHPAKPRLIQLWDLQVSTLGGTVCALLMHG